MKKMKTELPRFEIKPLSEADGKGYLNEFPDFPGCIADGETPEQAMAEGLDALLSHIRTLEELGRKVPESGAAFAGQWRQRVPKSLHAALVKKANNEGVSLNMLVTTILADGLARRMRIARGDFDGMQIGVHISKVACHRNSESPVGDARVAQRIPSMWSGLN